MVLSQTEICWTYSVFVLRSSSKRYISSLSITVFQVVVPSVSVTGISRELTPPFAFGLIYQWSFFAIRRDASQYLIWWTALSAFCPYLSAYLDARSSMCSSCIVMLFFCISLRFFHASDICFLIIVMYVVLLLLIDRRSLI